MVFMQVFGNNKKITKSVCLPFVCNFHFAKKVVYKSKSTFEVETLNSFLLFDPVPKMSNTRVHVKLDPLG